MAGADKAASEAAGEAAEKKEDPMDDPSKRNIFTKDGNVVQMVPSGVILSAGKSSIHMLKSGLVNFYAPAGLKISAGKQLSISGQNVTLEAGTQIKLKDQKGAEVTILKSAINVKGKEIYENS